jgi:hypothetical protein
VWDADRVVTLPADMVRGAPFYGVIALVVGTFSFLGLSKLLWRLRPRRS